MGSTSYSWTPMPSLTATKYMRYGYVTPRPFEPGQRYRNRREMEITVRINLAGDLKR